MAPLLSLALLWVGVAIPLADGSLWDQSVPVVSSTGGASPSPSHDHRHCLLVQSSPGWISHGTGPLEVSLVLLDLGSRGSNARVAFWAPRAPSARAPPIPS